MDQKFITVKFGHQNKKISVQQINYLTIKEIIRERFGVQDPIITYYDNDVDDWVDLEEDSNVYISDVRVLKLKVVEGEKREAIHDHQGEPDINDQQMPSTSCTGRPSTPSPLNRPATPSSRPATPSSRPDTPSSRPPTPSSRPPTPSNRSTSPSSRPVTPSVESTTVKAANRIWCRQYKIPKSNMSRTVLFKLENKEELTTTERRNILDGIYNDVTRYVGGMYPTSEMYEDIVDGLMREFPYLLTYRDLPPASAREFWKDKILYKFGNARKLLDKDHPDVKQRKKKIVVTEKDKDAAKTFTWGLAKFRPDLPVTEDETSFDLHVKWLQREHKKSDPDVEGVNRKMELTFPFRRKLVVDERISVSDLIEQFPWLTNRFELLKEFERLEPNTSTKDMVELLTEGLKKYRKGIVGVLKPKKKPDFLKEIDDASKHFRTEGQRNYADDCMALAGLPILFKEKPASLLIKEDESMPMGIKLKHNVMTLDSFEFSVFAEETEIFSCDSFFEAYSGLLACIYVMNLAYPKGLEKTFLFVQNILLGLRDDAGNNTIDKRIVNVLSLINAELKKN